MADSIAGVVLGAGAGTRLRPLTSVRPKVLCPVGPRALLTGRIEGTLGSAETVRGGIERAFGLLHRRQGTGERILGRALPAPQAGQLPDHLAAFPRPVCHLTIVAGSQAPAIARRPGGLARRATAPPGNASQPRWHTNSLTRSGCRTLAGLTSAVGAKLGANGHHS